METCFTIRKKVVTEDRGQHVSHVDTSHVMAEVPQGDLKRIFMREVRVAGSSKANLNVPLSEAI